MKLYQIDEKLINRIFDTLENIVGYIEDGLIEGFEERELCRYKWDVEDIIYHLDKIYDPEGVE